MAGRRVWTRTAITAVALAWMLAAVAAQCWLPQIHPQVSHPAHPLATSVGKEFAVNTDHAHLSDQSTAPCPKQFATAVLPRPAAEPQPAVAVAGATGIADVPIYLVVPAGRGPPAAPLSVHSGQDLLTQLCLDRR